MVEAINGNFWDNPQSDVGSCWLMNWWLILVDGWWPTINGMTVRENNPQQEGYGKLRLINDGTVCTVMSPSWVSIDWVKKRTGFWGLTCFMLVQEKIVRKWHLHHSKWTNSLHKRWMQKCKCKGVSVSRNNLSWWTQLCQEDHNSVDVLPSGVPTWWERLSNSYRIL